MINCKNIKKITNSIYSARIEFQKWQKQQWQHLAQQ